MIILCHIKIIYKSAITIIYFNLFILTSTNFFPWKFFGRYSSSTM